MLKNLALILSNPKYQGLITLNDTSVTIENQYSFLWNVLPKVTGKLIRKAQFAKEMRNFGFEMVDDRSPSNKQNSREKQQQGEKRLVFLAKSKDNLLALKKVEAIKEKRRQEKGKLDHKLKTLSSSFLSLKEGQSQSHIKEYELFQQVSSLKNINRSILQLNEEMSELINDSFEEDRIALYQDSTFEMLNNWSNVVHRPEQKGVYSMQMLEYYGQ